MRLRTSHCPHIVAERNQNAVLYLEPWQPVIQKKEQTVQLWIVIQIIKFSLSKTEILTKNKKFWDEL